MFEISDEFHPTSSTENSSIVTSAILSASQLYTEPFYNENERGASRSTKAKRFNTFCKTYNK